MHNKTIDLTTQSSEVVKQGYVAVRGQGLKSFLWPRRWMVLREGSLTTFDVLDLIFIKNITQISRVDLRPHCLKIASKDKTIHLLFSDSNDLYNWQDEIYQRSSLGASAPSNLKHLVSIKFNEESGDFSGLPPDWGVMLRKCVNEGRIKYEAREHESQRLRPIQNISSPTGVKHNIHIDYSAENGFTGLPSEWERLLDKSGISKDEVKANPQVVIDVLRFYTSMLTSSNAIQDMQVTLIPQQQHPQGSQQTEQTANKRKDSQQQQQQQQQQPTPKPFPRSSSLDKLANTVTAVSAPVVIQDISSPSNVQHHIHISHSSATGYSGLPSDWERQLNEPGEPAIKQSKKPAKQQIQEISGPTNVKHNIHISYNAETGLTGLPPRWQSILNQSGITQEEIKASPQTVIDVLRFYTTMLGSPSAIEDIHMTLTPKPKPRKLMDRSASSSSLNAVIGTTANDIPRLTITTATTVKKGSLSQMDFNNSASSALNRALNAVPVPDKPATTSKGSGMKKCSSLPELEPASAALSRAIHSISPPNHLVVLPRSASKVGSLSLVGQSPLRQSHSKTDLQKFE